jgi:hypothetical protein
MLETLSVVLLVGLQTVGDRNTPKAPGRRPVLVSEVRGGVGYAPRPEESR